MIPELAFNILYELGDPRMRGDDPRSADRILPLMQ